jgi:hypothetical protein
VVHTYDFELQQTIAAGSRNRVVWGGGERLYRYGITNTFLRHHYLDQYLKRGIGNQT